jgi:two-component system chemotaxis sensor kinase CheA
LSGSSDDRFREMFFEEARELLISLEEGLMDLERRQADRAHLDKTFRAAHSLKGAAGMVGLKAIAEFTNGIEAVLERIRGGSLAVDSDIITTLLESRDHLAAMVEADAAHSPIPPSSELTLRLTSLLRAPGATGPAAPGDPRRESPPPPASLRHATGDLRPRPPVAAPPSGASARPSGAQPARPDHSVRPPAADPPSSQVEPPPARTRSSKGRKRSSDTDTSAAAKSKTPRPKTRKMKQTPGAPAAYPSGEPAKGKGGEAVAVYQATFAPGPDVLRRGANPIGVLDELSELGTTTIAADTEHVPPLDQLDPERCYLRWKITVRTEADPERLREAFLFFADDSTVTIHRVLVDGTLVPLDGPTAAQAAVGTTIDTERPRGTLPSQEPGRGTVEVMPPDVPSAPSAPLVSSVAAPQPPVPPAAAPAATAVPSVLPRAHARIRVDSGQLDDLVGLAGELAVVSDNLMGMREVPGVETWTHALEALERVSRQIRDTTLDLRMVPVDELFSRFPRVVRDLADRSGKEIELRIVGQETKLDRTIVERLNDPMIHLIRNAVDHALEHPDDRLAKGKPRAGRITLGAGHEGDRVAIRVEDDGRGLDRDKIVRKGIALGMVPTGTAPDDPRVVSLIFHPGFSTRDTISELSGRGVGLDVVRDAVRALRGSVAVESTPGKGTAFVFRLPLTLALIDGLLVEMAGGRYVVPLAQVEECVALNGTRAALSQGRPCVAVRGELVPTVSLRTLFRANGPLPPRQELLLTRHAGQRVGVAVDRLVGRVQAVIQSLGEGLHGLSRFSGATILGDGTVSLILDLSALVSESRFAEQTARRSLQAGVKAESYR